MVCLMGNTYVVVEVDFDSSHPEIVGVGAVCCWERSKKKLVRWPGELWQQRIILGR